MNLKSKYTSCGRVATGYRGYVWSVVEEAELKGFPERLREASCLNCRKYNTFKKRGRVWQCCAQREEGRCRAADLFQVLKAVVAQGEDLEAVQAFHAFQSADPVVRQTQVTQFV